MACFKPRPVAYMHARNKKGNRYVMYTIPQWLSPLAYEKIYIPCRQCIGCKLKYSATWGARVFHESQMFEDNIFITLTYSDEKLPLDASLNYSDFQKFMKRFRERVSSRAHKKRFGFNPEKIRFFMCGEYGDRYGRPHFHACIFNYDFQDKYYWTTSNGFKLYRSDFLEELWTDPDDGIKYGYCSIGNVTYESAAYVARYCTKKRSGKLAPEYYKRFHVDEETGEVLQCVDVEPEFSHQSTNPGIGYEWYKKFGLTDVYVNDYVRVNGSNLVVPRYYDNKFKIEHGDRFDEIKARRLANALKHAENNTIFRLDVREEVQLARAKLLVRNFE